MDLRLEAAEGCHMPAGSFLAVKLGDALKQGRYEPSRTYQFPDVDKRRHAKIDIFKHVGSAAVLVSPEEGPHVSEVSITSSCPLVEDLRLKVNMNPICGKETEAPKSTIRVKAQSYLKKHCVEEKLSSCMKLLLQERPCDPIDFICSKLRGDDEAWSAPPSCDVEIQTDPVSIDDPCSQGDLVSMDGPDPDVRDLARGLLAEASANGSLLQILQEDVPRDQDLRHTTRTKLAKASAGGGLLKLLLDSAEENTSENSVKHQLASLHLEMNSALSVVRELEEKEKSLMASLGESFDRAQRPLTTDTSLSFSPSEGAARDAASGLISFACDRGQGLLQPTSSLRVPGTLGSRGKSPKSAHFEGDSLCVPVPYDSEELPLETSVKESHSAEDMFDHHIAQSREDCRSSFLENRMNALSEAVKNEVSDAYIAQARHDCASTFLQHRMDVLHSTVNQEVLLVTRELLAETRWFLEEHRAVLRSSEFVAESRLSTVKAEAEARMEASTGCPPSEANASNVSKDSHASFGFFKDLEEKELGCIVECSANESSMVGMSASCINSERCNAQVQVTTCVSWASWTAQPSVATWLNSNFGACVGPKGRHRACKPSVATWLQEISPEHVTRS